MSTPPVAGRWSLVALLMLLAWLWPRGDATAAPSDELTAARQQFRAGNFSAALPQLNLLLYPVPRLATPEALVEAHTLLGACAVETRETAMATREFTQALTLDENLTLDPLLFSAATIAHFLATKANLRERALAERQARELALERERLRRYRESLVFYEVRPYYVNFIPFGAGQFQNNHTTKGMFFATSQALTGGGSLAIWLYLVSNYGYNGRVPPEDAAAVRRWQQIQIGAGATCLGLMAWGVVDALVYYQPRAHVRGDDSLVPPPPIRGTPRPSPRAWRLAPLVAPDGTAGLQLQGAF